MTNPQTTTQKEAIEALELVIEQMKIYPVPNEIWTALSTLKLFVDLPTTKARRKVNA